MLISDRTVEFSAETATRLSAYRAGRRRCLTAKQSISTWNGYKHYPFSMLHPERVMQEVIIPAALMLSWSMALSVSCRTVQPRKNFDTCSLLTMRKKNSERILFTHERHRIKETVPVLGIPYCFCNHRRIDCRSVSCCPGSP